MKVCETEPAARKCSKEAKKEDFRCEKHLSPSLNKIQCSLRVKVLMIVLGFNLPRPEETSRFQLRGSLAETSSRNRKCLPTQLKYDTVSEFQGHRTFVKSDPSNLGADASPKGVGGERETHGTSAAAGVTGQARIAHFRGFAATLVHVCDCCSVEVVL